VSEELTLDAGAFLPPVWLRNQHVQSVIPSLPFRRPAVERGTRELVSRSRRLVLDCGDGVRLLAWHAVSPRAGDRSLTGGGRLAVLLHGWEGSAEAMYVLTLGQRLLERGFDVVRLNLRDHGGSHDLNEGIFHSCRIQEVVGAVRRIQELNSGHEMSLIGFSLGGNFFLRVGARAGGAGIAVRRIIALSPVLDPRHTLSSLESGWVLYRNYFVWKWRRSLKEKQAAWPQIYDLREVIGLKNLTDMTEWLACRYGRFPSLDAYLDGYAITGEALAGLTVPTRIIAAQDDPIIPATDLDRLARVPALEMTRTRFGGHCGFYSGRGDSWFIREVIATLESG
jgi:predicted alpha/beta-fold hydrolase